MASKDLKGGRVEYVVVTFQTTYQIYDSDVCLAVIGSIRDLGDWHLSKCLLAREDTRESGKWVARVTMAANTSFFWKLVIVSSDKMRILRWEDTPNRDTTIGDACEFVIIEAPWEAPETILPQYSQSRIQTDTGSSTEQHGYKLERRDRNLPGGGLAAFVRSDIPSRRRKDLECHDLENVTIKIPQVRTSMQGNGHDLTDTASGTPTGRPSDIQYEGHPLHDFAYFKKTFGKVYSTDQQHLAVNILQDRVYSTDQQHLPVDILQDRVMMCGLAATGNSKAFGRSQERNQLEMLITGKKVVGTDEDTVRKKIFKKNVDFVVSHNDEYKKGRRSFHVGVNFMSDRNDEEIKAILGFKLSRHGPKEERYFQPKLGAATLLKIDWRRGECVTPVKSQGQNNANGWAFSATGALEGQHARTTGELVSLSEQQLVDCCPQDGDINAAFKHIKTCGGIETEKQYPYEGERGMCRFDKDKVVVKVNAFYQINEGKEIELQEAVATVGPISVGIDCSPKAFRDYKGGIYDEESASTKDLNHAVLVVGYGEENGKKYWIVKNSWGDNWGDAGYIRMARNKNNQSGIATMASYPEVE